MHPISRDPDFTHVINALIEWSNGHDNKRPPLAKHEVHLIVAYIKHLENFAAFAKSEALLCSLNLRKIMEKI